MKVKFEGLVKILARQYGYRYTKSEIAEIIERDGASALNPAISYCGYGVWEIGKE